MGLRPHRGHRRSWRQSPDPHPLLSFVGVASQAGPPPPCTQAPPTVGPRVTMAAIPSAAQGLPLSSAERPEPFCLPCMEAPVGATRCHLVSLERELQLWLINYRGISTPRCGGVSPPRLIGWFFHLFNPSFYTHTLSLWLQAPLVLGIKS